MATENKQNRESVSSVKSSYPQSSNKVVLIGDVGVGKTSILNRYLYDTFDEQTEIT